MCEYITMDVSYDLCSNNIEIRRFDEEKRVKNHAMKHHTDAYIM